ncbi:MAG: helix-turn-helix domain-containing protein [Chloroflexota bacterium]
MEIFNDDVLTIDVGARLRQLRTERDMSMRALARASGLSTNALSMIERGRTSPSVSTLYKLAEALEVPITAFFRLEPPRQAIVFRRSSERKRVTVNQGIWEGLGGEAFSGRMEPFLMTLEPECGSGPFGMLHSGSEFVICLSGQVEYEVENQLYQLMPGDSLLFAAQHRHRWHNLGHTPAQVLVVLSGFDQSERPSEFHISSARKQPPAPLATDVIDRAEEMDLLEDEF